MVDAPRSSSSRRLVVRVALSIPRRRATLSTTTDQPTSLSHPEAVRPRRLRVARAFCPKGPIISLRPPRARKRSLSLRSGEAADCGVAVRIFVQRAASRTAKQEHPLVVGRDLLHVTKRPVLVVGRRSRNRTRPSHSRSALVHASESVPSAQSSQVEANVLVDALVGSRRRAPERAR